MTAFSFVSLSDAVLAFKKPWTYILARQLRDNLTASMQGASGAQPLAQQARSYQDFTASGTFTVPDYVTKVYVQVIGGGGGGGASMNSGVQTGGAAGGQAEGWVSVTPGALITVTIGAGGNGSAISADNATAGAASSFGSSVVAGGGARGRNTTTISSFDAFYAMEVSVRGGIGTAGQWLHCGSAGMLNNNNANGIGYAEGGRGIAGIGGNAAAANGTVYGEGGRSGSFGGGVAGYNGKSGLVRVWY